MAGAYNIVVSINPSGAQSGGRQVESALDRIERRMQSVQRLAAGLFAAAAVQRMTRELVGTADAYTQLQNRLRVVTTDSAQLAVVQEELFQSSQRTRTDLGANVEVYARLSLATKDLGVSARELLDFQETLNKAIVLSGTSAQEARSGIFQLSQAMSKGRLDGDELRSVLENIPVVADVIARGMGVTRGELRRLGEQGKITGDVILKAFATARDEIGGRFNTTIPTVSQSFVVLGNSLTNFIGKVDQLGGFSRSLANAIVTIADGIDYLASRVENFQLTNLKSQVEAFKLEKENLLRLQYRDQNDSLGNFFKGLKDRITGEKSNIDPDIVEKKLLEIYKDEQAVLGEIDKIEEGRRLRADARERLNDPGTKGKLPPTVEQEKYAEILRRSNAELDRENELLLLNAQEREVVGKLLKIEEKFQRNKTPISEADLDALERRMRSIQQLQELTRTAAEGFGSLFKGMEDSLVSFATTGRFEFKKFADQVVADLVRIALQAYVTKPLLNLATGLANPLLAGLGSSTYQSNGWTNTVTPSLLGFAGGGEFQVGGRGGTDSQLVAFRASPNERVKVTTPGQEAASRGGNTMVVNVINQAENTEVQQRESAGPDGAMITDIIVSTMRREIGSGGLDGALGARFGSSPTKKRR